MIEEAFHFETETGIHSLPPRRLEEFLLRNEELLLRRSNFDGTLRNFYLRRYDEWINTFVVLVLAVTSCSWELVRREVKGLSELLLRHFLTFSFFERFFK